MSASFLQRTGIFPYEGNVYSLIARQSQLAEHQTIPPADAFKRASGQLSGAPAAAVAPPSEEIRMTAPARSVGSVIRNSSARITGADSVLGSAIVDREGKRIGSMHDLMLDLASGRIAYAVVEMCTTRAARQLVVVPWNAVLSADLEKHEIRVNAHADWIERAPIVQEGTDPDRFVHEWGALIHNYFGTRPYWEGPRSPQHS
jgi:sporulation protein YlmC with PRC-barrel domain